MELELKKLNSDKIQSTGEKTIKMGMSDDAQAMIFQMFTETIYSNPIGSVVREIASNCFDSHVEAGIDSTKTPVMIKKTFDKVADQHYISFFDYGVGMSPERVENVYGVYFNSTKRTNNDEIGGFGIGGKTPLAYADTFFVITRYNGIQYQYSVYKGTETPEIELMFEKSTKERNGTEIRIPVKSSDLDRFEQEIERQLFYFEHIVFQGFSNDERLNSYNVYKGKNFIYRGSTYSDNIHLCLGKVAYPINYNTLGLDHWEYRVPIAIQFEIGDLKVTPNREEINYSDDTIKAIKEKLEIVKEELIVMLSKKYKNVRTLEDYYKAKENFGALEITPDDTVDISGWIKKNDINYENFKYKDLPKIPTTREIVPIFYNVHEYGYKRGYGYININYGDEVRPAVYQCAGEFKRKIIKQAYLNYTHDKHFVILKPYTTMFTNPSKLEDLKRTFGCLKDDGTGMYGALNLVPVIPAKKAEKLLKELAVDVKKFVDQYESYDELEVPEDFIEYRKQQRISKEVLKTTVPLKNGTGWGRERISVKNIIEFRGKIFYGTTDDEHNVTDGYRMFASMFGEKRIVSPSWRSGFSENKGVAFVICSKANEKYMKMCPNVYHIDLLYPIMLRRRMINPADIVIANDYHDKYAEIDGFYKSPKFGKINTTVVSHMKDIKKEIESLKKYRDYNGVNFNHRLITKYVKVDDAKKSVVIKTEKKLAWIREVQSKNAKTLKWISMPYYYGDEGIDFEDSRYSELIELLKKVMVF